MTLPASTCGGLSSPFEILAITPNASAYPYFGLSTLSQSAAVLDPNDNSTAGNYAVLLGTVSGAVFLILGTSTLRLIFPFVPSLRPAGCSQRDEEQLALVRSVPRI